MLDVLRVVAILCIWLSGMVFIWFRHKPWCAVVAFCLLAVALLWAIPLYILLSGGLLTL